MSANQKQFEQFFGSNEKDGEIILNSGELELADLVYKLASKKIQEDFDGEPDDDSDDEPSDDDTDEDVEFNEKIVAAKDNFKRVVELFKLSNKAKNTFLENFGEWSSLRESNIKRLKEIAEEIQSDKFNCDIAKVVGGVVGIVGGIVAGLSFLTPLAVVTVPLAIGGGVATAVGGGVAVGTITTEIVLLKNKLEEAKNLAIQEEENFSKMSQWFAHTQELKKALSSLIDCDLLEELSKDLAEFSKEAEEKVESLKDEFRNLLMTCIGKMCKRSKIVEIFGTAFAPVVMTFVLVICILRDPNRLMLNCILQVERFVVGLMSALGIGVQAGRLTFQLAAKGAAAATRATSVVVATSVFIALAVVVDVVNVVLSSIDIHNRPEPEHAKKIREAAEQLEKEFSFIQSVYGELKKWKCIDPADVKEWKTFIISRVPPNTVHIDIKKAIQLHLSEEAWGCIKIPKESIDGNTWFFKVPTSHSNMLLQQTELFIKTNSCRVTQCPTLWKTFIVQHIPDEATEEDIKLAIKSHLNEQAWNSIKLKKISTSGNNWFLKIPVRYSQNLAQQPYIIIKGDRCLITQ